jgi:hypothetical protein
MLFVWGYKILVNRVYELCVYRERERERDRERVAPLERGNLCLYIILWSDLV